MYNYESWNTAKWNGMWDGSNTRLALIYVWELEKLAIAALCTPKVIVDLTMVKSRMVTC